MKREELRNSEIEREETVNCKVIEGGSGWSEDRNWYVYTVKWNPLDVLNNLNTPKKRTKQE